MPRPARAFRNSLPPHSPGCPPAPRGLLLSHVLRHVRTNRRGAAPLGSPLREGRTRRTCAARLPPPAAEPSGPAPPPPLAAAARGGRGRCRHGERDVTAATRGHPANQRAPGGLARRPNQGPRCAVRHRPKNARCCQSVGAKVRPRWRHGAHEGVPGRVRAGFRYRWRARVAGVRGSGRSGGGRGRGQERRGEAAAAAAAAPPPPPPRPASRSAFLLRLPPATPDRGSARFSAPLPPAASGERVGPGPPVTRGGGPSAAPGLGPCRPLSA